MKNFDELLPIPGDPFFSLEPMAARYTERAPGTLCVEVSFPELLARAEKPSKIRELAPCQGVVRDLAVRVARAPDISEMGFCYLADEYFLLEQEGVACLIVLNPDENHELSVLDLFLHELTHFFRGEPHDWLFLCALSSLRVRCGLPPSFDAYDMRDGVEFLDLPDDIQRDAPLIQQWCNSLGQRLAELPHFPRGLHETLAALEMEVEARACTIRSPAEFMALAEGARVA